MRGSMKSPAPHIRRIKEGYGDKFTGKRAGRFVSTCCHAQAVREVAIPDADGKERWICPDCGEECEVEKVEDPRIVQKGLR